MNEALQLKMDQSLFDYQPNSIAACVLYAITQPKRCDVVSLQFRPLMQSI